jgi:hypothetical protein
MDARGDGDDDRRYQHHLLDLFARLVVYHEMDSQPIGKKQTNIDRKKEENTPEFSGLSA